MQFLYFIPNQTNVKPAIAAAGIADLLGENITSRAMYVGPDKLGGLMLHCGTPADCHYKPAVQTWRIANSGLFYIGFYNESPPTAAELAHKTQIEGNSIELGDSDLWLIPLARIFPVGTKLPQSLVLGSKGEVVKEILPQFAKFSAKCEKFWRDFQIGVGLISGQPEMLESEAIELAAEAIGLNYKINIDGINALKLFTTQNIAEILALIVDAPTVMKNLKFAIDEKKKSIAVPEPLNSGSAGK